MAFIEESNGSCKSAFSDLQCALGNLRNAVVSNSEFPDSDKLLLNIDEAMGWETVKDLDKMKEIFILLLNIGMQSNAPKEVLECISVVREDMALALSAIAEGK